MMCIYTYSLYFEMTTLLNTLKIPNQRNQNKELQYNNLTAQTRQIIPDPILSGKQPQHFGRSPNIGVEYIFFFFFG